MLVTEGARESCMHVFYLQGSDEDVKDEQPSEKTEPKQLTPREGSGAHPCSQGIVSRPVLILIMLPVVSGRHPQKKDKECRPAEV